MIKDLSRTQATDPGNVSRADQIVAQPRNNKQQRQDNARPRKLQITHYDAFANNIANNKWFESKVKWERG